jgi:hypothetical protein
MDSVYSCVCATGNEETEVHPDLHAVAHLIQVNTGSATAFVTLKSAEHCAVAQQVLLSHDSGWAPWDTMGHQMKKLFAPSERC